MLSDHFIGESFDFNFFEEIFKQMGIIKKETNLDNKSVRIVNRLGKYLVDKQIYEVEKLIGKDIFTQTVRVKGKEDLKVINIMLSV